MPHALRRRLCAVSLVAGGLASCAGVERRLVADSAPELIDRAAAAVDPCAAAHVATGSTDGLGRPAPPSSAWRQLMRVFGEPDFADTADDESAVRCVELGSPAFWDRFVRAGEAGGVAYAVDGNVQPPTCRHLTSEEWSLITRAFEVVPPMLPGDRRQGELWDAPTVVVEVARVGEVETWSGAATRGDHPMMEACQLLWSIASPSYRAPGYL